MAYTVKVSNVSHNALTQDIEALFSGCGQIEAVDLSSDGAGAQIAFVTFQTQDAARSALLLTGSVLKGKGVHVSELRTTSSSTAADGADHSNNSNDNSQGTKVRNTNLGSIMERLRLTTKGIVSKPSAPPQDHPQAATPDCSSSSSTTTMTTVQKCLNHMVMINDKLQVGALSSVQQGVAYSKSLLGTWVTQPVGKQSSTDPSDPLNPTSPVESSKKPSRFLGVIPTSFKVSASPADQVQLTEMTTFSNEKL